MSCDCLLILPILFYRFIVWVTPNCFEETHIHRESFSVQLQWTYSNEGGWYSDFYRTSISTRDTFYVLLGLRLRKLGEANVEKFVRRLCKNMNTKGQVPSMFRRSWCSGETPIYKSNDIDIVDSNAFFLILVWWMCEKDSNKMNKELYLYCQRAFRCLENNQCTNTMYEPVGASWETTRQHDGYLLLTNVLTIQAIRSMELLAMIRKDTVLQASCVDKHGKFLQKWQPELYRTQEVLPRILAVHWAMVPSNFLLSFNQELHADWIPLRTAGPIIDRTTFKSWIKGKSDMHTTVVWPFVGFLWIAILAKRMKMDLARTWWASYIEFHYPQTLYNIYSKETGKPIHRAFLKALPAHSMTISMYLAANQSISGFSTYNQSQSV